MERSNQVYIDLNSTAPDITFNLAIYEKTQAAFFKIAGASYVAGASLGAGIAATTENRTGEFIGAAAFLAGMTISMLTSGLALRARSESNRLLNIARARNLRVEGRFKRRIID